MSAPYRSAASNRRLASGLGALRALVRLVCGFLSVKLTAVYLGPSGLALIAQLNNFLSLCQGVVSNGLDTASGRLTAEYREDEQRRRRLLGTLGKVGLGLGIPTALVVISTSPWLASWLLKDASFAWVFVVAAVSNLAVLFNGMLLGALSARGDIARVVFSHIGATILGLLIFAPTAMRWGVNGGLYAAASIYIGSLAVTLLLIYRSPLIKLRDFVGRFDRDEARRILSFYPMLIVHAVSVPLSLILVRDGVVSTLSLESAGLWQACWRLSETYLTVVMMSVTTQFMVRLGEQINFPDRLRSEMLKTLVLAVGATVGCAVGIYLLREWIVKLLFSSEFLPVADIIGVQLIGDIFKIIGHTLGFVLVATLRSGWYISIDIAVPVIFVVLARVLAVDMGVLGVTTSYVIASLIHCILSLIALRDLFFHLRPQA